MIELSIAGGLGNQMLEYAYARAISEEFGDPEIVINPYFNSYYRLHGILIGGFPELYDCQLGLFELNPHVTEMSPVKGLTTAFVQVARGCLIRYGVLHPNTTSDKFEKRTRKGKFEMLDRQYTYYAHSRVCEKTRKRVLGWFQSEKYFSKIRPILLKEFQFKAPPSPKNQDMIDELSSCNSVCVHIRRGDLALSYSQYSVRRAGEGYFTAGMKYVAERTDDPVFYIFSDTHDDIEWIKHNYKFEFPVKYVDLENPGWDDLRLMYHCKHFVMSKSTFSWWGSYMSQNPDKIVVIPEMPVAVESWLNDENSDDFYRDDMTKIYAEADKVRPG